MDLQKILFPRVGICTVNAMYFHTKAPQIFSLGQERLKLSKDDIVVFDTFYNSFSIGKWRKYTNIKNLYLQVNVCGDFTITLWHKERINNSLQSHVLVAKHFLQEECESICIEFPFDFTTGMYYFSLQAHNDDVIFLGGKYVTEIEDVNPVNIGLAICTYKKENYIYKNLKNLSQEILQNEKSPAYGHLTVFIADNAQTLDCSKIADDHVYVFPNINAGGTGGFTRALLEVLDREDQDKFTHIIFMDDDVVFEPDIFARTYALLSCLKLKYLHCSIGGATLRLETMHIQHTRGDCWNGGFGAQRNVKAGYDLSKVDNLLKNELEERVQYNSWLFSCVPLSVVKKIGLPIPIFVHRDDLEYGLRNGSPIIHLNGIGAWHSFGTAYPGANLYYDIRNALIVNAIHYPAHEINEKRILSYIKKQMNDSLLRFRYSEVDLMFRGIEDFCQGVDWLKEQDPVDLHKEITHIGYRPLHSEELPRPVNIQQFWNSFNFSESKKNKSKRKFMLNGWIGRSKRILTVSLLYCRPINFFRVKQAIQYNQSNDTGIVTEKNYSELFRILWKYLKIRRLIYKKIGAVSAEYHERYQELITEKFWRQYLKLEKQNEEPKSIVHPTGKMSVPQKNIKSTWIKKHLPKIWNKFYKFMNPYPYSYRAALDTHLRILGCWLLKKFHLDGLNPRMQQIQQAKNRHAGERCFVIGLGPSLQIGDLERLKNEYTFAANNIFLLFDKTDWRPTYYCRMDKIGSERVLDDLKRKDPEKYSSYLLNGQIPQVEAYLHSKIKVNSPTGKERYVHINHGNHTKTRMLNRHWKHSDDIDISIYELYTVTIMAIEIALYMGFKEIYLLGVDCDYSNSGGKIHVVETSGDDNIRHSVGKQRMQNYTTSYMRDAFYYINCVAKEKGVKIYNATRGGALEEFERVNFDSLNLR